VKKLYITGWLYDDPKMGSRLALSRGIQTLSGRGVRCVACFPPMYGTSQGPAHPVQRGRIVEYRTSANWTEPGTTVLREVTDPVLVAEVEAAETAVLDAQRLVDVAKEALAETLSSVVARSKPARVET